MFRKISVTVLKVIGTVVCVYSAFMILFVSTFDLLSLSSYMSFTTFLVEKIIPNASTVIALILLILYIWIPRDTKSGSLLKGFNSRDNNVCN